MSKRYVQSSMNASSQEPTRTQEALSVLLCGGLAGVATWVSIFPLGNKLTPRPLVKLCLPNVPRRDQDSSPDLRSPPSHHLRLTTSSERITTAYKTEHSQHCSKCVPKRRSCSLLPWHRHLQRTSVCCECCTMGCKYIPCELSFQIYSSLTFKCL